MEIRHQEPLTGEEDAPMGSSLEFKNVTFAYEDTDVLKDVSLSIPARVSRRWWAPRAAARVQLPGLSPVSGMWMEGGYCLTAGISGR